MGEFFNKGLKKEDKKNIEDKSEDQLEVLSKINKISRLAKNESDYNYNHKFAFYRFYRGFEKI